MPAPVQTAHAADVSRTHSLDVTDYMKRSFGSVYVNDVQDNPLQPDINYRGYTASPLLGTAQGMSVYLDGMRLNQPFGDVVSWDLIPKQAISTLTLMPGSNPVFGLNTLGGALSLRTKDGFSDPGYSIGLNYGSDSRRQIELEAGGHADSGLYWYGTANKLKDDGWRDASPTDATQAFAKLGWRDANTDIALNGAYANTDLTGNGLQDQQFLQKDYASVYTVPDNTRNKAGLLNLVATHKVGDALTLSATRTTATSRPTPSTATSTTTRWARTCTSPRRAMRQPRVRVTATRSLRPATRDCRLRRKHWPPRRFLPMPASRTSC